MIVVLSELFSFNKFDIGCFTAGTKDYAEPILVDIEAKVFQHLNTTSKRPLFAVKKYRDDCTITSKTQYKDLSKIEGYDSDKILLIDDLYSNFANNETNGMPIKAYVDINKPDYELTKIILILRQFDFERPLQQ